MARDLQTKNFIPNSQVRKLLIYKVKESVGECTRCVDCQQSLIFLCKITPRVTHVVTSLSAISLAEIRTGRILREKADCKQSTLHMYMKRPIRNSLPASENWSEHRNSQPFT